MGYKSPKNFFALYHKTKELNKLKELSAGWLRVPPPGCIVNNGEESFEGQDLLETVAWCPQAEQGKQSPWPPAPMSPFQAQDAAILPCAHRGDPSAMFPSVLWK